MVDGKRTAKQHISAKRPFDDINDEQFSGSTARRTRARRANDVAPDVQLPRRAIRSRPNALTRQRALEEAEQRALEEAQQQSLAETQQQVQQQNQETTLVAILQSVGLRNDKFADKLLRLLRQERRRDARSPSISSICSTNSERSAVSTGSHNSIASSNSSSNLADLASMAGLPTTLRGREFSPPEPEHIEWGHFNNINWDKGATNGPPSEPKSPRTI
ncbi:hypothetical protein M434DRAFT_385115 [Hypoxylon sp. CO27-5]|nr:hypothetical protein M434DRAFT_385115 [Hypoxylon sp. CO27-5]